MKNTFKITQALNLFEEKLFSLTRPAYAHEKEAPTYHVKIGRDPSCTCLYSQKTSTVCKHRLWVMLFLLKIPEDSYLLHQKAFTPGEVKYILQRDMEHNMPTVSTAQETSQSSQQATQIHQHSAQHHSTQQHPTQQHPTLQHPTLQHPTQQHSTQQHPSQQHPTQQHPILQHPTQQHPTATFYTATSYTATSFTATSFTATSYTATSYTATSFTATSSRAIAKQ